MGKKYDFTAPNHDVGDLFGEKAPQSFAELFRIDDISPERNDIVYVSIDKLKDYSNHRFQRIKNWEDFKESINAQGILNPIIVRPDQEEGFYEILAGHNRTMAARELGLNEIPAMIKEVDDITASVIVGVSNNQRELYYFRQKSLLKQSQSDIAL